MCFCVDWVCRCWNPHHKHTLHRSTQRRNLRSRSRHGPLQPWTQLYSETSDSTEEPLSDRSVCLQHTACKHPGALFEGRTYWFHVWIFICLHLKLCEAAYISWQVETVWIWYIFCFVYFRPGCVPVWLCRCSRRSAHLRLGHSQTQPPSGCYQPGKENKSSEQQTQRGVTACQHSAERPLYTHILMTNQ